MFAFKSPFQRRAATVLAAAFAAWCTSGLAAAPPSTLNYQGRLFSSGTGAPVPDSSGNSITFRIFNVPSGGSALWTENWNSGTGQWVTTSNGLFNVVLGSINPINLLFDQPYWLEVHTYVGGTLEASPMSPRQPMTTAPYAFRSVYADNASVTAPLSLSSTTDGATIYVEQMGNLGDPVGIYAKTAPPGNGVAIVATTESIAATTVPNNGVAVYGHSSGQAAFMARNTGNIGFKTAIMALNTATSASGSAVMGENASGSGNGIYGYNKANTGNPVGLRGETTGTAANRVGIVAGSEIVGSWPSGQIGLYSLSTGPTGYGVVTQGTVRGLSVTATDAAGMAIEARAASTGPAVQITNAGSGTPLRMNGMNFPANDGVAGEVLTTNGAGQLLWSPSAGVSAPLSLTSTSAASTIFADNTGSGNGLVGRSSGPSNAGVYGISSSLGGGVSYGVRGETSDPGGYGVMGFNGAVTGLARGVAGFTNSTSGRAVQGLAQAATGTSYGVWGQASSAAGVGVMGKNTSTAPPVISAGVGVYGFTEGINSIAVFGRHQNASVAGYGLWGESTSSSGTGVRGEAVAATGITYGVYGTATSSSGYGVYGNSTNNIGVYGASGSGGGQGGFFVNTSGSNSAEALRAQSASGIGAAFVGVTGAVGVSASPVGVGLLGENTSLVGEAHGMVGVSHAPFGIGVVGSNDSATGDAIAVLGISQNSINSRGGFFLGTGIGVKGQAYGAGATGVEASDGGNVGATALYVDGIGHFRTYADFDPAPGPPVVAPPNRARIAYDFGADQLVLSKNGAPYTPIGGGGVPNPLALTNGLPFGQAVISGTSTADSYGVAGYNSTPGGFNTPGPPQVGDFINAGMMGYTNVSLSAGVLGQYDAANPAGGGVIGLGFVGMRGIGSTAFAGSIGGSFETDGQNGRGLEANANGIGGTGAYIRGMAIGLSVTATNGGPGNGLALFAEGNEAAALLRSYGSEATARIENQGGGYAIIGQNNNNSWAAIWGNNDSADPNAYGIYGTTVGGTNQAYGVRGLSNNTLGRGVFGEGYIGVEGYSTNGSGHGVLGSNAASGGIPVGVKGQANNAAASVRIGVQGTVSTLSFSAPSGGIGTMGYNDEPSGNGVWGQATSNTNPIGVVGTTSNNPTRPTGGVGVFGHTAAVSGTGVYGRNTGTSNNGNGIYGVNPGQGNTGTGVRGFNSGSANTGTGVVGENSSDGGFGILAANGANTAAGTGGALKVKGEMAVEALSSTQPGGTFFTMDEPNGSIRLSGATPVSAIFTVNNLYVKETSLVIATIMQSSGSGLPPYAVQIAPGGSAFQIRMSAGASLDAGSYINFMVINQK